MFNQNSALVIIWAEKVKAGLPIEEVPQLFNLREEVEKKVVA